MAKQKPDESLSPEAAADLLLAKADSQREQRSENLALKKAREELAALRKALNLIHEVEAAKVEPPKWLAPKVASKGHHATVNLLLTDTHWDEVVVPEQIEYINCYNRAIAERRLKKVFQETISLTRDYLAGVTYDGVLLMLGGDMLSGNIHEELKETNVSTLFDSIVHWVEHLIAGIRLLADHFGKVHVGAVVGNHGRLTRKPRAKYRAQDNADWLLYKIVARDFKNDPRVTFDIPNSADLLLKTYDTTYLLTHGDQFRGGSGIAGAMSPLLLGTNRKTRRQAAAGRPYQIMVCGHFHQYINIPSKGLIVGPTLKGMDEYAFLNNFEPEPAAAAMWLTTPEHGPGFALPIVVQDRKAEGW